MVDLARAERLHVQVRTGRSAGSTFRGWTAAQVGRRLDNASGSFQLEAIPGRDVLVPIRQGDEVALVFDGHTVLVGYVDGYEAALDATSHTLTIVGRDRSAQLVDCTPIDEAAEVNGYSLQQIAQWLAAPLQVPLEFEGGATPPEYLTEPFDKFAVDPGEKAWDALERACRFRGVLAHSGTEGRLRIGRPGLVSAGVDLLQGERGGRLGQVLGIKARVSLADRYSVVVVKGQALGAEFLPADLAHIEAQSLDPTVPLYRPLVLVAEGPVDAITAQLRANWEATVRAARASSVEVLVPDWLRGPGLPPWDVGELVPVLSPRLDIDATLLIAGVEFRFSNDGYTTLLSLVRPDAFTPEVELPQDPLDESGEDPEGEEGEL